MDDEEKWIHDSMLFRELVGSMGWDQYCAHLENEEKDRVEELIGEISEGRSSWLKGYIQGIRWAVYHPQYVITKMKERP